MKHINNMPDAKNSGSGGIEMSREELEIISVQSGKSIIRLELDTGKAVRFLADGSALAMEGEFPQSLIDAGRVCPESADEILELCAAAKRRERHGRCGMWLNAPDGRRRWCAVEYDLLPEPNGQPTHAIFSIRDETELHEREQAYDKWRDSLLTMFAENASYAEFNLTRGVLERQMGTAEGPAARSGSSMQDFVDYACDHFIFEEDRDGYREFFDRQRLLALCERGVTEDTIEYRDCRGGVHWMRASVQMTRYPGSTEVKAFIVYNDIDRQRSELERLARLASRDSLTNILNRKALEDRITERLESAESGELSALYIVDLDNFKQINDRFGHQAGDETLKNVASALNRTFRSGDIVGRLGGDEFMAFISGVTEPNAVARANRLLNELQFMVENASLSASVGLALCRGTAKFSELYRGADIALYKSKEMGKNRCTVYRHNEQRSQQSEVQVGQIKESGMIQLQTLLEYMDGGVIIVEVRDDDLNEVYISPSYYATMRRLPGDQEENKALFNGIADEYKSAVLETLNRTTQTGQPGDIIYQVKSDGDAEWHHLRAARLPGGDGSKRIIGVVTDVSELKKSSSELEAIVGYSTVGIAMFETSDSGTRARFVNPKLREMIGLDIEKINASAEILEKLTGGHMSRCAAEAEDAAEDTFEFVCSGADIGGGEERLCMQARGVHIFDLAGSSVVLIMYSDITRERAMEEQLRMAEERYRIAAAQAGMAIWEVDIATHTMRFISARTDGTVPEEEVYTNAPESNLKRGLIHPDSEQVLRAMYDDIYSGRESDEYVLRRRDADGAYVWARARYTFVRDNDGSIRHAVGVSELIPNIDAELRELNWTYQFSVLIEDLLLGTIHANLTRDRIDYIHVTGVDKSEIGAVSLEDCKKLLRGFMADNEENARRLEELTPEWLIGLYREGHINYMFEFRTSNGGWNNLFFDLMRDPLSGDILSFIYLRDVSNKRVTESLLPQAVSYDTVTRLYSYATVRAAMEAVIGRLDVSCGVIISVLDLVGLDQLKSKRGMAEANRVLNIVGRLFRLLVGDNAVFGHLTQNRFIVMHTDISQKKKWRDLMLRIVEQANDLLHKSDVSQTVGFVCGYVYSRAGDADCGTLIRQASVACRAAVGSGLSMAEYNAVEPGCLSDDADTVEVDSSASPEMAELKKKYQLLELSYQQLVNRQQSSDYDNATGLYSLPAFTRAAQERLKDAPGGYCAVSCQVEGYNVYCRVNGSQAGDRLISALAEKIKTADALVARSEPDCLTAFVRQEGFDAGQLYGLLDHRLAELTAAFEMNVKMGCCLPDDNDDSAALMCGRAASAMRAVLNCGCVIYDPAVHGDSPDIQQETSELMGALAREQLVIMLRPLKDSVSGDTVGADAVLCWDHPIRGRLYPDSFIPLFERCGMTGQLAEYVIDRCCVFVRRWQKKHGYSIPLYISGGNTGLDMFMPGLIRVFERHLNHHGADRNALIPEVRENAYLEDSGRLSALIDKLHESGFRVGVEGFGCGCSPVNMLVDMPFDSIRLDPDFVGRDMESKRGKCVLAALLNAARQMGVTAIVTGSKAMENGRELARLGCVISEEDSLDRLLTAEQMLCLDESGVKSADGMDTYWKGAVGLAIEMGDYEMVSAMIEAVCDSSLCGVIVASAEGEREVHYANREACRALARRNSREFSSSDRSGLVDCIMPEDRDYFERCLEQLRSSKVPVEFECRAVNGSEEIVWIKGLLKNVTVDAGQNMVVCEFADTTDCHGETQEQLLSSYSGAMMACFNEICEANFDTQTLTVRYSGYGNRLLGVTRPLWEAVEKLCAGHVIPEDGDKLRDYIRRVGGMSAGEYVSVEYDLLGKGGKIHTIFSRAVPIDSTRCLICNTDITRHRLKTEQLAHEALLSGMRRERENYYSMVERLGSTIVEWDLTDGTCWSSDSCARYDISSKDSVSSGGMVSSGVHSDDMIHFAMFMSRLEGGADYADTTVRMHMSDGEYRWTKLNGEAVRDDRGMPIRMLVSLTDVDDEVRNQRQIDSYNARSMAFIENLPSGVLIASISSDYRVTGSANERFCSFMGYTVEQLEKTMQEQWMNIVSPGDRKWITSEIRQLVTGRQKQIDVICSLRHREGYDVPIRVLAALIGRDETSTSIAFICVDEQIESV